jgi:prevent-host-death family protein
MHLLSLFVQYTLQQLRDQLDILIARSEAGEELVITSDGRPVVRIVPVPQAEQVPGKRPPAGWGKGRIHLAPNFDEPLEDFKEYMG